MKYAIKFVSIPELMTACEALLASPDIESVHFETDDVYEIDSEPVFDGSLFEMQNGKWKTEVDGEMYTLEECSFPNDASFFLTYTLHGE